MFLYYGRQSCEIGYQALPFSMCNTEELGGAWGQSYDWSTGVGMSAQSVCTRPLFGPGDETNGVR